LQQRGCEIGFSPAGFVWHYRRSTLGAYLSQQRGYGEAEALLAQKHPENFNWWGGGIWRGRIYSASKFGVQIQAPVIYHGLFGSAGFQRLYVSEPATILMLSTNLEYHLLVTLPLWILSVIFHQLFPVAVASLLLSLGVCTAAAIQAVMPANKIRWWSRPLIGLLFFLQPIVRGWARYQGQLNLGPLPSLASRQSLDSLALLGKRQPLGEVRYWSQQRTDRFALISSILERLKQNGWATRSDIGWSEYDAEVHGSRWSLLQLTTITEDHPNDQQMIRCRLKAKWSLTAKIAFWFLAGADVLAIGSLPSWRPWSWFLLLTLPAPIGFWRWIEGIFRVSPWFC